MTGSETHPVEPNLDAIRAMLDAAALRYDPQRHGPLETAAEYRTRTGERHRVCINLHPELDWRVIDLAPDGSATLVGRLEGIDDIRPQALALACDYAEQCRLHQSGRREDPPILRAKAMQITRRRRRAAAAAGRGKPSVTKPPASRNRRVLAAHAAAH